MKKICYTELSYVLGIVILAFGTALMERADFGMSMVVAPAYLLHLKISEVAPWFTFGMAEYLLQAVLLIAIGIVMGRFRSSYLVSFFTAVFYGVALDLCIAAVALLPEAGMVGRVLFYVLGLILCSVGVALLFHTYISPEAYELLVKEIARKWNREISRVKTVYDCCSCAVGIVLSFAFFGMWHFEGVKVGTVICALVNGWLIGRIGRFLEARFAFQDRWNLRNWFEGQE